ncbi:MAG: hypothetical protein KGL53_10750, partial [Elusimicrobia bacterium]|nr:hypothetical protein [Elusimicrobiota bacterium]
MAGCAATGDVAVSPLDRPVPDTPPPEGLCASLVYGLTCVAPRGYDLVQEGPGPGIVMRYASRSDVPAERAHLML